VLKKINDIIHKKELNEDIEQQDKFKILKALLAGEKLYVDDEAFNQSDGKKIDVEYHCNPKLKDGSVVGAVITFIDITEKKKDQEQIKYLSDHDSLTGLMNRRSFESSLKKLNLTSTLPISIIFGDLNGLKLINDIFGHVAGDMLIQKAAKVLQEVCGESNIVARVGGDEFIAILPEKDAFSTIKIIQQIKDELSKETVCSVKCSMALGFDTKMHASENLEKIVGNAETEMYKEKLLSKRNFGVETIQTILNTLQKRFPKEKRHSEKVASLCVKMGKALGLEETELKRLNDAGNVHDIGKIVLEEDLLKNKDLSKDGIRKMKQHPIVGYKILNIFDETLDLADAVYAHHEKWDGSGYPKGLKGEEIPLISRIISIVDTYDEFLTTNEGDEVQSIALHKIAEQSGHDFDPKLTEVFVKMLS
jgi:diguanylate cyclase (GGDEF)-like protein